MEMLTAEEIELIENFRNTNDELKRVTQELARCNRIASEKLRRAGEGLQ